MITTDLLSAFNFFGLDMANHLWQSTLFAGAAWLVTIFLKKNRARIRYWVWFAVSIKFLIPFSLIVSMSGLIAPDWKKAPVEISQEWSVIQTINQPFNPPELKKISPTLEIIDVPSPSGKIPWIIFSLWLCGSLAILLNWYTQRLRVSGMVRKAELLKDGHTVKGFHRIKLENRISHTVQLLSTRDTMEPGVFGIFRPVILIPTGILSHINDAELEAILLHELAHIRFKDNLVAFIHMLVEALFWFHPIVWWTGSRLVAERELACDESVLQSGKNPLVYAEGILKVCEYYFIAPLACVSGVIGSNLKTRVELIMKNQIGHKLSLAKIFMLSLSGLLVLCIPLSIGMLNAPPGQAHPSSDNSIESKAVAYKPDIHVVSSKPEKMNASSKTVITTADKDISSGINSEASLQEGQTLLADKAAGPGMAAEPSPDNMKRSSEEVSTIKKKLSKKLEIRNNSPAVVMAETGIQTSINIVKKTDSIKADQEPALSTDNEDKVLFARMDSPVKVSADKVNMGTEVGAEDTDPDQNKDISHLEKPNPIPEKYNLDNELEALNRISIFNIRSFENIDKQSLILRTSYSEYYLFVLRRPRLIIPHGRTDFDFQGSTITAGHDRIVMSYPGTEYYVIDKIYKLKGRKQVTEIKERLLNG